MQICRTFNDYFRPLNILPRFETQAQLSAQPGYFRFGPSLICYGQCCSATPEPNCAGLLRDVSGHVELNATSVLVPFDLDEVIENLRLERYAAAPVRLVRRRLRSFARALYYSVRPFLGVGIRKHIQRLATAGWQHIPFPSWPVDSSVDDLMRQLLALAMKARGITTLPFIWFWPHGYDCAVIVTHDVETAAGRDFCSTLMDWDNSFGIKSSFQLIPEERYTIPAESVEKIKQCGFEVAIHDLNHDGSLFYAASKFEDRVARLREYAAHYGAFGFRSGALYRNFEWFGRLPFSYDMSAPNVAHLDPQHGGCCTVMPYMIGDVVELPLTTVQDYNLFNILGSYSTDLWKEQIAAISRHNGLITILVHPDYLNAADACRAYDGLLHHLATLCSTTRIWQALPRDVARWWAQRAQMNLVLRDGSLRVEGPGSERAAIGYAVLDGRNVVYTTDYPSNSCADGKYKGSAA